MDAIVKPAGRTCVIGQPVTWKWIADGRYDTAQLDRVQSQLVKAIHPCALSALHSSPMHTPAEIALWKLVTRQFRLDPHSVHGPSHWLKVRRNGLYLASFHPADPEVVKLFALFHDSCRWDEYRDPHRGPRGAQLALALRQAGHFQLDDLQMDLLVAACNIHNGGTPQTEPTLATCLDADRLDLGRVGIIPDPRLLSTSTAQSIASRGAWHELE